MILSDVFTSQKLLEEYNCSLSPLSLFGSYRRSHNNVIILYLRMHWAIFIKTFHFVVKYFALITAFWTLLCCPTVGNHSDIRKHQFDVKWDEKKKSKHLFSTWMKLWQTWDILHARERSRWRMPVQINSVVYLHAILFRMYERDTGIKLQIPN